MCDSLQTLQEVQTIVDTIFVSLSDSLYVKIQNLANENNNPLTDFTKNSLTILLALLAGFIALLQVKSNIISSARIKWLESLRNDLSELYSSAMDTVHYSHIYLKNSGEKEKQAESDYSKNHSKSNVLVNKIKMNLNPCESEHKKLIDLLDTIDTKLDSENIAKVTQSDLEIILKKIVDQSRLVFKPEWEKSKKIFRR